MSLGRRICLWQIRRPSEVREGSNWSPVVVVVAATKSTIVPIPDVLTPLLLLGVLGGEGVGG